jgi:hypothetical protein
MDDSRVTMNDQGDHSVNETNYEKSLYLDLMKRCLLNFIYGEYETSEVSPNGFLKSMIVRIFTNRGISLVRKKPMNYEIRLEGRDWPGFAQSMIGTKRMNNLQFCIEDILRNNIPGDFIETGVWRGGSTIFMKAVLKVHNVNNRIVWVADSFEGLPSPNPVKYPHDSDSRWHQYKMMSVPLEQVKRNFESYGLLDDRVRFLKGWFSETLPQLHEERFALLRLDGDMYESTIDALSNLYPRLSTGGYIIVDDYGCIQACREAVEDYRNNNGIQDNINVIDWAGIYWKKSR